MVPHWVMITSPAGAFYGLPVLASWGGAAAYGFGTPGLAVLGEGTAKAVRSAGGQVAWTSPTPNAKDALLALLAEVLQPGQHLLWLCGNRFDPNLLTLAEAHGVTLLPWVVYNTVDVTPNPDVLWEIARALPQADDATGAAPTHVTWVVTSGSAVEQALRWQLPALWAARPQPPELTWLCLGPKTWAQAQAANLPGSIVKPPEEQTGSMGFDTLARWWVQELGRRQQH